MNKLVDLQEIDFCDYCMIDMTHFDGVTCSCPDHQDLVWCNELHKRYGHVDEEFGDWYEECKLNEDKKL